MAAGYADATHGVTLLGRGVRPCSRTWSFGDSGRGRSARGERRLLVWHYSYDDQHNHHADARRTITLRGGRLDAPNRLALQTTSCAAS